MVDRVDLVPAGANPGAHIALFKQRDLPSPITQEVAVSDVEKVEEVETVAKADHDAALSELETLRAQVAKAAETATEAETLRKSLADTQADIAKMRLENRTREFVAKAAEFAPLGKADDIGGLLMAADEHLTAEQNQFLGRLLKGAAAQIEKGDLFAQFSKADGGESAGWAERLTKDAQALVDAGTATTIEVAKQMVMHKDPSIRAEYAQQMRGDR